MQFYIHWCVVLHWTHWGLYFKKFLCTCLGSYFSQKATTVGRPPNFSIHISQLCWIIEPQYFITLSLDSHWTYFWKHYIYNKKDTKFGSQNLATKFGFVPDCKCDTNRADISPLMPMHQDPLLVIIDIMMRYRFMKVYVFVDLSKALHDINFYSRKLKSRHRWNPTNTVLKCVRFEDNNSWMLSLITRFMGPAWCPPGSCRPQVDPMLAP